MTTTNAHVTELVRAVFNVARGRLLDGSYPQRGYISVPRDQWEFIVREAYLARPIGRERDLFPDCPGCHEEGMHPSHLGSMGCESGSIASGGYKAHCTCRACF